MVGRCVRSSVGVSVNGSPINHLVSGRCDTR